MRSAVTSARRCVSLVIPPWSSVIQTTTLTFEWQMNCCLLHACFEYRRCLISFQLFEKSWKEILVRTKDIRPVRQNFRQNNKQRHKECFHSSGSMKTRCPRKQADKMFPAFLHFYVTYDSKLNIFAFWMVCQTNRRYENVTLGSENWWWALFTISWHFKRWNN